MTAFGRRGGASASPMLLRAQARPANAARWLVGWLLDALERDRERRMLLGLDDRMLRDIGITRVDALREGEKPFWRD